jgi:hypothetical protein
VERALGVEEQWAQRENQALFAAGFEPTDIEKSALWIKDGVWYGRNAALQRVRQTLSMESTDGEVYNEQAS